MIAKLNIQEQVAWDTKHDNYDTKSVMANVATARYYAVARKQYTILLLPKRPYVLSPDFDSEYDPETMIVTEYNPEIGTHKVDLSYHNKSPLHSRNGRIRHIGKVDILATLLYYHMTTDTFDICPIYTTDLGKSTYEIFYLDNLSLNYTVPNQIPSRPPYVFHYLAKRIEHYRKHYLEHGRKGKIVFPAGLDRGGFTIWYNTKRKS